MFGDKFKNDFGQGSKNYNPFSSSTSGVQTTSKSNGWSWLSKVDFGSAAGGLLPSTGSFEGDLIAGGLKSSVSAFVSGDIMGAFNGVMGTVKTLLNPDEYRNKVTVSRAKKIWQKFTNSAKGLDDINELFHESLKQWRFEKTKKGAYESRYLDALMPLETALLSDGYTFTLGKDKADGKYDYEYKIWTEPTAVQQVYNRVVDGVQNATGSIGGSNNLLMGGLALGLFALLKNKKFK